MNGRYRLLLLRLVSGRLLDSYVSSSIIKSGVHWPAWFLKITFIWEVGTYYYVCVSAPRLLMANGVMWHDVK